MKSNSMAVQLFPTWLDQPGVLRLFAQRCQFQQHCKTSTEWNQTVWQCSSFPPDWTNLGYCHHLHWYINSNTIAKLSQQYPLCCYTVHKRHTSFHIYLSFFSKHPPHFQLPLTDSYKVVCMVVYPPYRRKCRSLYSTRVHFHLIHIFLTCHYTTECFIDIYVNVEF